MSVENDNLDADITGRIFFNFQNLNTSANEFIFLLTNFSLLYRYTHTFVVHEKEKGTPLRSYISRAVNVGATFNVYGNVSK